MNKDLAYIKLMLEDISAIADKVTSGNVSHNIATIKCEARKALECLDSMQEEPVSEDLEEVISYLSKRYPEVSFAKLSRIAVYVAKWQREQDQEIIELAEDHAMFAGMEKMKEEMMAKAIDAVVKFEYSNNGKTYGFVDYDFFALEDMGFKAEDKVKLIIIKED